MKLISFVVQCGILYLAWIGGREVWERSIDAAAERAADQINHPSRRAA